MINTPVNSEDGDSFLGPMRGPFDVLLKNYALWNTLHGMIPCAGCGNRHLHSRYQNLPRDPVLHRSDSE